MDKRWNQQTLEDLIEVKHGFAFSGEYFTDEPRRDVLVTPGNFALGGGFSTSNQKYYDGPVPDEFVLSEGDLIVTMTDLSRTGDTLGLPAIIRSGEQSTRYLHNQRIGKVLIDPRAPLDKHYLYFLMRSKDYRNEILASATGTTVKHTSPTRIGKYRFNLPPVDEQRAIASILGSFDDKVDLNRKMSETLEAMVQALFRSWFVDFEPVRAKADGRNTGLSKRISDLFPDSFTESPIGPIPTGWRYGLLGDLANQIRSGVQPGDITPNESYISLDHMPRKSIALANWDENAAIASNKARFSKGDILFGKLRPYFHKAGVAACDGICSTDIVVMNSARSEYFSIVLGHVSSEAFIQYTNAVSAGTKMPRVNWKDIARYEVVIPPADLAKHLTEVIRLQVERISTLIHESRAIAALRDLVLPKLVSGKLHVKDTESLLAASK